MLILLNNQEIKICRGKKTSVKYYLFYAFYPLKDCLHVIAMFNVKFKSSNSILFKMSKLNTNGIFDVTFAQ